MFATCFEVPEALPWPGGDQGAGLGRAGVPLWAAEGICAGAEWHKT